jgi:arginine:ornithine antiporter / lysine permease
MHAAGPVHLPLGCLIYAPGSVLYIRARYERGQRLARGELWACGGSWLLALAGALALLTGAVAV